MTKLTGLLLSSAVASALVTFAAAPAQAQEFPAHFLWADELVTNITADANTWGSPCAITWGDPFTQTGYSAKTNGACLFTKSLQKADPTITNSLLNFWWGSASPSSPIFHDHIAAGNHFETIEDFGLAQPGDVLATKYLSSGMETGYLMILAQSEYVGVAADGVTHRYFVYVYDSTRSPHGDTDERWNGDLGAHDHGVGSGYLYVDTDADGAIVAHSWSTVFSGSYYTQAQRNVVVGRFER